MLPTEGEINTYLIKLVGIITPYPSGNKQGGYIFMPLVTTNNPMPSMNRDY